MGTILSDILKNGETPKQEPKSNTLLSKVLKYQEPGHAEGMALGQYGVGESKFDTEINSKNVDQLDYIRGNKQGLADKWANGIVKAAGVAGTSALESTAGVVYGIGQAFHEGDVSKLYNNDFNQTLDEFNKYVATNMPHYHTKAEQDYSFMQKLGTANFWSDQALNGAAYMTGAIATGWGLSKFASLGKLVRAGKVIDEAALATKGFSELDNAAKMIRIADAVDFGKNAALMSAGESGTEARDILNSTYKTQVDNFVKQYGQEPPEELKKYFMTASKSAGNAGYAANLAITGLTNALLFPKLLSKGYAANKLKLNNIALTGNVYVAETENLLKGISKEGIVGAFEEGSQELAQLFTQKTLTDYYSRAFRDKKDQHSFVESLAEGMSQTMTQEGLENFFLGAIMGAPAAAIHARGDIAQKNADTKQIAELANDPTFKKTIQQFDNFVRATSYESDKNEALSKGSKFDYLSAEFNQNKAIAKMFIDKNAIDFLVDQYEGMKTMPESEFKKVAGYDENSPLPKTQGEIVENAIKFVKQLDKTNNSIQTLFPYSEKEHGTSENYKILTDNLWHYSTSIENMDKRTKELHNDIMKLALDNSVSIIDNIDNPTAPYGIQGNPLVAEQVNQINEDLHVAKLYKDALIDAYKKVADPTTRKETLDAIKEDAAQKNAESTAQISEKEPVDNTDEATAKYYEDLANTLKSKYPDFDLTSTSESSKDGNFIIVDKNGKEIPADVHEDIINTTKEIESRYFKEGIEPTNTTTQTPTEKPVETVIHPIQQVVNDLIKEKQSLIDNINKDTSIVATDKVTEINKIEKEYEAKIATFYNQLSSSAISEEDKEAVSEYLKHNTVNNIESITQTELDILSINNVLENIGRIRTIINAVMMHLFNHTIKDGIFKFSRDEEGYIQIDPNSKVNVKEVNNIKRGDKVELRLVTLTEEELANNNKRIDESLKNPIVKRQDFDGKAIGIYSNGNLIGFVQEPHSSIATYVPKIINGKLAGTSEIATTILNNTDSEKLRQDLIKYRKETIAKLETGKTVTEEVTAKGNGNLYTKLKPNGTIDAIRDVLNNSRPKDVKNGSLLFAYHNGNNLVLPLSDLSDKDSNAINEFLFKLKIGSKGQVFQIVKDLTGGHAVIPVYGNTVNDVTITKIVNLIKGFTNETAPRDIVQAINKYIYSSTTKDKNASVTVTVENNKIKLTVNTETFNLEDINSTPTILKSFKEALLTQPQNIPAENLNNNEFQKDMKERNTLVSNVLEYQGEYFVQPYVEYSQNLKSVPQAKPTVNQEVAAEVVQTNTDTINVNDILGNTTSEKPTTFNPQEGINDDTALSSTKFEGKLDIAKFEKWKNKNLPQLGMATATETADALARLKSTMVDAYGMFKDLTIYLFKDATNKTAYHEAFHGVFRNMLTLAEKHAILKEAVAKYEAPTLEQLALLQKGLSKEYSNEQLTYLYYEEKLADEFADYTNAYETRSIGQKILDFFKRIGKYFNIFNTYKADTIDDLFNKVNTGSFKSKSIVKTSKIDKLSIVNRPFEVFDDSYAYSKDLDRLFTVNGKSILIKKIGNQFLAIHQANIEQGKPSIPFNIHKEIRDRYETYFNAEQAKRDAGKPYDHSSYQYAGLAAHWYPQLEQEVSKYLSLRRVNSKVEFVKSEEGIIEDDLGDIEITSLRSATTKGFQESTSVAGVTSASTRMKIFLSSIPVLENGKEKKDVYGITEYYPFDKLYYYIETNLTEIYEFDKQLDKLRELGENKPELLQIVDKLTNKSSLVKNNQFRLLQNDFKTNFSKQQLAYVLTQFFSDAVTGKLSYKIFDANRTSIKVETLSKWQDNLKDSSRKTIAKADPTTGLMNEFNTTSGHSLKEQWIGLYNKPTIDKKVISILLSKLGIELSPITLEAVVDTVAFRNSVTQILNWYTSDNTNAALAQYGRLALEKLAAFETTNVMNNYTSSFNNVENKNIYTVQLPSWASKMMAKFKSDDSDSFKAYLSDLQRDPILKHSNLLKDLLSNNKFRKESFRLSYWDGLKDGNGNRDGSKFTSTTSEDWFKNQIALFQNTFVNKDKTLADKIAKYIYMIPSDKSMSMIFDARVYNISFVSGDTKNTIGGNLELNENSEIFDKYYNVYLGEQERIEHNKVLVNGILETKNLEKLKTLLQYYHISKDNWNSFVELVENKKELTEAEWKEVATYIDGAAFDYNYFSKSFNKIAKNSNVSSSDILKQLKIDLKQEVDNVRTEMLEKGLITREDGLLKSIGIEVDGKNAKEIHDNINQLIASYALNSKLFNIESSNLFNGDFAQYKPGDLQKRTYQSQAGFTYGLWDRPTYKVIVKKDYKHKSESEHPNYQDINVTDAQVLVTPEFYREFLIANGRWSDEHDDAYAIVEGESNPTKIKEALHVLLGAIKPVSVGSRFDKNLNIQRFEQIKCAILPLFKGYIEMNPLFKEKLAEMKATNADMMGFESAFKATIGFRSDITSSDDVILDLETGNLGIQVDNPEHLLDAENDSLRQMKMLLPGSIDTSKTYNGVSGQVILDKLMEMEAINIKESLRELQTLLGDKSNANFVEFIKDMVTKRGATSNVEELLSIINGTFTYPLDNGTLSTQIENMVSSVYTNRVVKQAFGVGGSGVQATSLGFKFRNLKEQQEVVDKRKVLKVIQQELQWIKPDGKGGISYAECVMPSWAKQFFNENGYLKDIEGIPEELKQLIMYRIPTEGLHSMLPIKVVKFLPETMGNFILLPYEITQQFGADFDFDKVYFIGREFYNDRRTGDMTGKLTQYSISDDINERYNQYVEYTYDNKLNTLSKEEFSELPIDQQVTRAARNNAIVDGYLHLLTSIENYDLITTPSGFDDLIKIKEKFFKDDKTKESFFSSITQRDYKDRNHIGLALKGLWALHVSGHSYTVLMNLSTENYDIRSGELIESKTIKFNNVISTFDKHIKNGVKLPFNKINSINGDFIADKIGSVAAGVLDDIKNPLLASLGIDKNTSDVIASIIRSGHNIDTAIMFGAQEGIKTMSKLLNVNYNKIKIPGQKTNTINDILKDYFTLMNNAIGKINDDNISKNPKFLESIEASKDNAPNINDSELSYHLDKFKFKTKGPVSILQIAENKVDTNGKTIKEYKDATAEETALYYAFQVRCLTAFDNYSKIANELVDMNKIFAINKEVGPNIENIMAKKQLISEIKDPLRIFKGFNMKQVPALEQTYNVHMRALDFISEYFPYDSPYYNQIKLYVNNIQTSSKLSKAKVETKIFINSFIRTYMDAKFELFKNIPSNYENLFVSLPNQLLDILDTNKGETKLGNLTYDAIRNNLFLKSLDVNNKYFKDTGMKFITLKGNRLDQQVKEDLITSFKLLYNNANTKELAKQLIEYSFASTGFYTGLNSYSALISPEILKELKYMDYRSEKIKELITNKNEPTSVDMNRIVDQLIRNNPQMFTKVYDFTLFLKIDETKQLPNSISTSIDLIKIAGKERELILEQTEEYDRLTQYIRVFDKVLGRTVIYKNEGLGSFTYEKVEALGKKGFFIEVDPTNDIEKSFVTTNSSTSKSTESSSSIEDSNETSESEILNIEDVLGGSTNNQPTQSSTDVKPKTPFSKDLPDDTTSCQ